MQTIGIVGGGIMGSGIAQVCAQAGFKVLLVEATSNLCLQAKSKIEKSTNKAVDKGKLTRKEAKKVLGQIEITSDLAQLKEAFIVIEAIPEVLKLKQKLFKQLDRLLPLETILASNTSSLPIKKLAKVTQRPDKVIGMHFMNPVPSMPLVEIVVSMKTSKTTLASVKQLTEQLWKTPVISKDSPGFISNRILTPMLNEAILCFQERVGTKEDIDNVMKLGMRHPMGPLELADHIGLDTLLEIQNVLYKEFKKSKYKPASLLIKMVKAGKLGRKSGEGFYNYSVKSEKK